MQLKNKLSADKNTGKAWCFTLNNYTEDEAGLAMTWAEEHTAYAVFGWELAKATYTPHIQGYFRLDRNGNMRYIHYGGLIPIQ